MPDRQENPEDRSDAGSQGLPEGGDSIDTVTFAQILEMDDDEDEREFSKSIVYGFFDQAKSTFETMEMMLEKKNLAELSSLGHFLKGSSATLGLDKIKDSCEKIQHFGAHKDETGSKPEPDDAQCLQRIKDTLADVKVEYAEVEKVLKRFYRDPEAQGS